MGQDRLHLFGIRHHGPGSAASLERALDELDPSAVLVEGPPEADAILAHAAAPGMRPPLAILVHAADDPSRSSFFPFADYSPEWRAILWALKRDRPVRFIDLPAAHDLAETPEDDEHAEAVAPEEESEQESADPGQAVEEPDAEALTRVDPLSLLAQAAGHSDGESWWNALVEQQRHAPAVFAAIEQAMTALRDEHGTLYAEGSRERDREARREAHMRLEIGRCLEETAGTVAVVTGAWHVPALRGPSKAKEDRALLKGLPKTKATATWVPWTDGRLAAASGYRAGIVSPGWYRHVWTEFGRPGPADVTGAAARWQARVAGLLRGEGQIAATASVIEAVRLAETLAALRGFALPGLAEMRDASLATLCHGEPTALALIERRLVVGESVGEIDEAVPQMPLAADLARWQKRVRVKPEALDRELLLDLRSEAGLLKSTLFHRLLLIDTPWGRLTEAGGGRGTFRERWTVRWEPELSVKLAEALVWGVTIEQAAGNRAISIARESGDVGEIAETVERCLLAGLAAPAEQCIGRLQAVAVNASDIRGLMDAVSPLANVLRYGTAREMPLDALRLLVTSLTEEICIGMAHGCRQLDAEAADALRQAMVRFDGAIRLLEDERLTADWLRALTGVADDDGAEALLAGVAVRQLYDRGALDGEAAAAYLSRALSPGVAPAVAGAWLEGFLAEAGQLLLHDPVLFGVIDRWMIGLPEDDFVALLPMLRRAFSSIDSMERRRLFQAAREGPKPTAAARADAVADDHAASAAFGRALPLLTTILGLEGAS